MASCTVVMLILFVALRAGRTFGGVPPATPHCTGDIIEHAVMSLGESRIVPFNGSIGECHHFRVTLSQLAQFTGGAVSFQIHTRNRDATLGRDLDFPLGESTWGRHIGLMRFFGDVPSLTLTGVDFYAAFDPLFAAPTSSAAAAAAGNASTSVVPGRALVVAHYISSNDPVPGGCASTSNLEYDPQLSLTYDSLSTTVTFMDGNLPQRPVCDQGVNPPVKQITYFVYAYFLPELIYDEDVLFAAILKMINTSDVLTDGYKVLNLELSPADPKRAVFNSVTGNGVVYNVLMVGGGENVYIPMATYSCDLESCPLSASVIVRVTGTVIGFLGIFLCLLGHRCFHLEVPIVSGGMAFFVFFCILSAHTTWSDVAVQLVSAGFGIVIAAAMTLLWLLFGLAYPFVFVFSLFGCFLFGWIVLFTPLGTVKYMDVSYIYALALLCLTVVLCIPFMILELGRACCPRALKRGLPSKITNVIVCAFIGSFAVIYWVTCFIPNSLSLIWSNVLDRLTLPGFDFTQYQAYPFELKEILFSVAWAILMGVGIVVQCLLSRKQPPFPEVSLYRKLKARRKRVREARGGGVHGSTAGAPSSSRNMPRVGIRGERSPLLSPAESPSGYRTLVN